MKLYTKKFSDKEKRTSLDAFENKPYCSHTYTTKMISYSKNRFNGIEITTGVFNEN